MHTEPPSPPSTLQAALCSPLVTPLAAIPMTALTMGIYADSVDLLIKLPFVTMAALGYGYLGMILICLPIMMLLRRLDALDAIRLCLCTTIVGALAWAGVSSSGREPGSLPLLADLSTGAVCGVAVCMTFCLLRGIPFRVTAGAYPASSSRDTD